MSAIAQSRPLVFAPFLMVLFVGTLTTSMIIPYMTFYIAEGLGKAPLHISLFAGLEAIIAVGSNRLFAHWLDKGSPPFPMIGVSIAGFLIASATLAVAPSYELVMTVGVVGFAIGTSAISTMFSFGTILIERHDIDRGRLNAYMRATVSTSWMIGPALSFFVASQFDQYAVFRLATVIGLCWAAMWWFTIPRDAAIAPKVALNGATSDDIATGTWLAVAFVFCLSSANSLTFTALPLFFVQEVGLPTYAPGAAFSMKTFVEIPVIFSTPFLIARFGLKRSLIGTAVLAVVAMLLLSSVQSFTQMIAASALEGVWYGLYASLGISFIQSYAANRPARATALYWNTLTLSGILAGPAVGMIAQAHSFHAVIITASVIAAIAMAILFTVKRPHRG